MTSRNPTLRALRKGGGREGGKEKSPVPKITLTAANSMINNYKYLPAK